MRIVVHDYSGHPFQAQLSRELARRGHQVWHITSADFQTPKGRLTADDAGSRLTMLNLSLGEPFQKDSFIRRRAQEEAFGRRVGAEIGRIKPDLVLSSNAPLDTQRGIQSAARRTGAAFVFWVQDLYGEAISRILRGKFGALGQMVGQHYRRLEQRMLRASDAIVVISPDFMPVLEKNGVPVAAVDVIENWAPLDELAYFGPAAGPGGPIRALYAGTLGYKHDPSLLAELAGLEGLEVRVHSEGRVADELKAAAVSRPGLSVEPWAPFDALPRVLAGADVLLAMIEADAGVFSVPSKILTYLCAGRPILAAVPEANLAARILRESGAGLVSAPGDRATLLANARRLADDPQLRFDMGRRGRAYAEREFDITAIADRFEALFEGLDATASVATAAA